MRPIVSGLLLLAALLATARSTALAQLPTRPQASPLWSTALDAGAESAGGRSARRDLTRAEGLGIGAAIGGLTAGILGYQVCQAYSALGDCLGNAFWWAAVGGLMGGLMGASAAGENDPPGGSP